ncbi:MAG TPA: polysaccharide deacetylase family protein [Jatrophihabitantaceae bacterium]
MTTSPSRFGLSAEHRAAARGSTAVVTTSWDDGHVYDYALANLLDQYGLPGTFYISPRDCELPSRARLTPRDISALGDRFEIGGHTMTHVRLPTLSDAAAAREIADGKTYLEDVAGKAVTSFCYPGGAYDRRHVSMVADAGFAVARTVERHRIDWPGNPLEMPTSFNTYRHLSDPRAAYDWAVRSPRRAARLFLNWEEWAIEMFERVLTFGGVFHLWGHSWEIAANNDWSRLERVFAHISRRDGVTYVPNGSVLEHAPPAGAA